MEADTEAGGTPLPPAPTPRRTVVDGDGRRLTLESRSEDAGPEFEAALASLYDRFEDDDRAQGVPPASPARRQEWLERLLATPGVGVVVRHEGRVVGHGRLLGDGDGPAELAIFVDPQYQDAGVGTELLGALLSAGRERGVSGVVLSVERSNAPAMGLYRRFGFEAINYGRYEVEMERPL